MQKSKREYQNTEQYDYQRTLEYALYLLSKNIYTEKVLREKINTKQTDPEIVEPVIEELIQLRLVDDLSYAKGFVMSREQRYGRHRIKRDLLQKGIKNSYIEEAMKEMGDQTELIEKLIDTKIKLLRIEREDLIDYEQKYKIKNKIMAHLVNKGFDYGEISNAIEKAFKQFLEVE